MNLIAKEMVKNHGLTSIPGWEQSIPIHPMLHGVEQFPIKLGHMSSDESVQCLEEQFFSQEYP